MTGRPYLPPLFVSHGSPMLAITPSPGREFLGRLGRDYEANHGRPQAILCVSAHWETRRPAVSGTPRPETIHDFYGFPDALYQLRYPAPGAPALAEEVAALLREAGIGCAIDPGQGLDHGAWMPLLQMWPAADIPVAQFAIQQPLGPAHHFALGAALQALTGRNVLVMASGGAVHNVRDAMRRRGGPPPDWATGFDGWLDRQLAAGDVEALLAWQDAPGAADAHPRDEHLLPLFVALGAAGNGARGVRLHESFEGSLVMSTWRFEPR